MDRGTPEGTPEYPNLQPMPNWKRGQSGNPEGRPKGAKDGIGAHCRRMLAKDFSFETIKQELTEKGFDLSDGSTSEAISAVLIAKALSGDLNAIQMLEKYELDAPLRDPNEKPYINITLVQAPNTELPPNMKKEITINGRSWPINVKGNGGPDYGADCE